MSVAPVIARVEPIAGESLLSLVTRTAHANVFPRLSDLLSHAGVSGSPCYIPFTAVDRAQPLAELLGLALDEVSGRMHPLHPDQSLKHGVSWAGIRMRRRAIESKLRRVAPLALKASPHHRLEWAHRALSFCPQTLQQLISTCPACKAKLGWSATKGVDRCERCEASLGDAHAPMVQTRSPDRLRVAAGLISPDAQVRVESLAQFPPEFQGWDTGDLFTALCELGVTWRRPGEGRGSPLARAVFDGSYAFEPEDLARGHAVLSGWPTMGRELLDRLVAASTSRRKNGRLIRSNLGLLGRHLAPEATDPRLKKLLTQLVEEEADEHRSKDARTKAAAVVQRAKLAGSIGLVEACKLFEICRPVLRRLVPNGRSLIADPWQGCAGMRFDPDALAQTIIAYQSSTSFRDVSRELGAPRYCLPSLIEAGVLERCCDSDVELLFRDGAVTARSWSELRKALEAPTRRTTLILLTPLSAHLRRRFDPQVWALAFRHVLDRPNVRMATKVIEADPRPLMARVHVIGHELCEGLPADDPSRIDRNVVLSAQDAGRLLGLTGSRVPELFETGHLQAHRVGLAWGVKLGDVVDFHARYVTGSEIRQRFVLPFKDDDVKGFFPDPRDYEGFTQTRQIKLCLREALERDWEWPDPTLR